jgi:hypothetical protein
MTLPLEWRDGDLLLRLRVQPKASQDAFAGLYGDAIKIRITATPTDGKANSHLQRLLAKKFGTTSSKVTIESGLSSRSKRVRIKDPTTFPAELKAYSQPSTDP